MKVPCGGTGVAYGRKSGEARGLIRVAVTGRLVGLSLFECLQVLCRERTLVRLWKAAVLS
ncbi:hypothetical protein [Actinoallomurus acaciae]|uniref:Aminoacyl-tRNA synthetase class I anticodon-binding domain-containing protein n=1 Tax=Actinoallomurus acaciae TaxID=502577 RepID=A0ABV5YUG9_9ACTN